MASPGNKSAQAYTADARKYARSPVRSAWRKDSSASANRRSSSPVRAQPAMQPGEHRPRRLVEPIQEPEPPEHRFRGL